MLRRARLGAEGGGGGGAGDGGRRHGDGEDVQVVGRGAGRGRGHAHVVDAPAVTLGTLQLADDLIVLVQQALQLR